MKPDDGLDFDCDEGRRHQREEDITPAMEEDRRLSTEAWRRISEHMQGVISHSDGEVDRMKKGRRLILDAEIEVWIAKRRAGVRCLDIAREARVSLHTVRRYTKGSCL
jgi:hypothetical protein